eukprot:m.209834 g.209834  ORF g.209834 m.209834 type:complete len:62 (+) comp15819_c0_seq20:1377-1562(+)
MFALQKILNQRPTRSQPCENYSDIPFCLRYEKDIFWNLSILYILILILSNFNAIASLGKHI